ncbi:Beta-fructofuranosidase [Abeliophyllum distichum]|uniref:Beta-fructofuranosidase n=1 Tax=Abeliophyllum distichum TaxID=126358 RepID=A0ABD1VP45_9LAMI
MLNNGVEASHHVHVHLQSISAENVKDLHRTGYHFQPTKHWINDPNGPMYFNGVYHLFYQYNPKGAVWGNIVWAHSVSKDLINWERLEPAIFPSKSFDKYGCWSGSATILPGNKPVILYSGIIDKNNTQVQNYAVPENVSDPYLRKWIKPDNNPLIVADKHVNKTAFRDPTTAWLGKDGQWRITLGSRKKDKGVSLLYKSKDFMNWTKSKKPLHSLAGTGNWECPDFFPVSIQGTKELDTSVIEGDIKHVMKISLDATRYDYYTLGTYDTKKDKYIPDKGMVDGWNVEELETLRGKKVELINKKLDKGERVEIEGIPAAQADVEVTFSFNSLEKAEPFDPSWDRYDAQKLCSQKGSTVQGGLGPFGLLTLASEKLEEYTPVFFRIFKDQEQKHVVLMCSDASSSSLEDKKGMYKPSSAGFVDVDINDKKLSLRSLIDHSVVESFGAKGKTCITSRVYPTIATYDNAHLYAFNNGTETVEIESLNAWSMNKPQLMNH